MGSERRLSLERMDAGRRRRLGPTPRSLLFWRNPGGAYGRRLGSEYWDVAGSQGKVASLAYERDGRLRTDWKNRPIFAAGWLDVDVEDRGREDERTRGRRD